MPETRQSGATHARRNPENQALLDEFCDALWLEDGLARNTLDSYRRDVRQFAEWLAKRDGKRLLDADHGDIQGYLAYRYARKARATSAARLLSALKRFYRHAVRGGRTQVDPTLKTAPRPVGGACGANRIPIVIPCHRVLGANGIGGFMRGRGADALAIKRWLLRHEGVRVL